MNQPLYFFGKKGRILQGEHPGWIVEIADDTQGDTGGYFVLVYNEEEAFDWWLEKQEHIPFFIDDMEWVIDWLDEREVKC